MPITNEPELNRVTRMTRILYGFSECDLEGFCDLCGFLSGGKVDWVTESDGDGTGADEELMSLFQLE